MTEFGYVKLTHPTRELNDVLVPSKYRAVKYEPHEGAIARIRNSDVKYDLDENGFPPYPLVGEIVEVREEWDYTEYLLVYLDDVEEWYREDDLIVMVPSNMW